MDYWFPENIFHPILFQKPFLRGNLLKVPEKNANRYCYYLEGFSIVEKESQGKNVGKQITVPVFWLVFVLRYKLSPSFSILTPASVSFLLSFPLPSKIPRCLLMLFLYASCICKYREKGWKTLILPEFWKFGTFFSRRQFKEGGGSGEGSEERKVGRKERCKTLKSD